MNKNCNEGAILMDTNGVVWGRSEKPKKKKTVEIEIELLKRIAKHFEFSLAVFFTQQDAFNSKVTRDEVIYKKAKLFDKIVEIVEEAEE